MNAGLAERGSGPGSARSMLVFGVGAAVAAVAPLAGGSDQRFLGAFAIYFVWVTLAVSWNVAGGFAGLINLGLVAFFGVGAVVGGVAMESGLPAAAAVALSVLAGSALAVCLTPIFRLKRFYFALGTLVIPLMVKPLAEVASGAADFRLPMAEVMAPGELYYAGLGMAVFAVVSVFLLVRSKAGFALRAIGDDELASSTVGVNVNAYKAVALVTSAALASLAGVYYLEIAGTVDTTIFQNLNFSLLPLFMVTLGGTGTLEGPVVGALIFSALSYFVTSQLPGSTLDVFVISVAVIGVALLRPKGLMSGARRG